MKIPVVKWNRCRWYHLTSPVDEGILKWLQDEFGLSDLDLDDCRSEAVLRPKWERHEKYSFFIFQFARLDEGDKIKILELKAFIGSNFLITVGSPDILAGDWFLDMNSGKEKFLLKNGVSFLLFKLTDRLIDKGMQTVRACLKSPP